MLTMRVTPKTSDNPAPTKNRLDAAASPLSAWNATASRVIPRNVDLRSTPPSAQNNRPHPEEHRVAMRLEGWPRARTVPPSFETRAQARAPQDDVCCLMTSFEVF